jgi:hypothetical protein
MDIFTYKCVTLEDFCDYVGWDYDDAMEALLHSPISFGPNDDTLVMPSTLADICEMDLPETFDFDIMISLGS